MKTTLAAESDFRWAMDSPSLLDLPACVTSPVTAQAVAPPNVSAHPPLGRYFESLVGHWIKDGLQARELVRNTVLFRGKETLGELDFLFTTAQEPEVTQHWEVAIKFYLCQGRKGATLSDYIGPNGRDRLDLKIDKLLNQQLPLGSSPEAKLWLATSGLPSSVRSHLFIKGILFYPLDSDWRTVTAPAPIAPEHLRGWWARTAGATSPPQFDPSQFAADSQWVILPKIRWLTGVATGTNVIPLNFTQLQEALSIAPLPVCVAELSREGHAWVERSRGMIVTQDWPNTPRLT